MEVIFLVILGAIISYAILYFIIKAAVRNGIIEARNIDSAKYNPYSDENRIAQKICPNCKKEHDCDFPKCPYCKFDYIKHMN